MIHISSTRAMYWVSFLSHFDMIILTGFMGIILWKFLGLTTNPYSFKKTPAPYRIIWGMHSYVNHDDDNVSHFLIEKCCVTVKCQHVVA